MKLVKKWTNFIKNIQKKVKRKWRLFKLRVNALLKSIALFFIALWNTLFVTPYRFVKKWWNLLVWRHVCRFYRWLERKTSFFRWRKFASNSSDEERKRYTLFVEILGGWKNVSAIRCKTNSWHLRIIHSFLIDWDKFPHFGIKVIYWEWPYLNLAVGSYSKWIFKRLKKFTDMPKKIRKRKAKSQVSFS